MLSMMETVNWCTRLNRFMLYRLTYRSDWVEERNTWRNFLVSSEELAEIS